MARRTSKAAQNAIALQGTNVSNIPASQQEYLAAELGHSVDYEGEPLGLDLPLLRRDSQFREFILSIWRQFQAERTMNSQARELDQEGLTAAELWEPGITEFLPTTSTPDQMRRYKQKLLFRANFLEAVLTETIGELKKLDRAKPIAEEITEIATVPTPGGAADKGQQEATGRMSAPRAESGPRGRRRRAP